MLTGIVSWVKALQDYFTAQPHGKKIEISEFKQLSDKDKQDFHDMLVAEGYKLEPIKSN